MIDTRQHPVLNTKLMQFWPTQAPSNLVTGALWYDKATDSFYVVESGQVMPMMLPPGSIIMSGASATPNGYLECRGQSLTYAAYPRLYNSIGTAFGLGGGGIGDFSNPDFRGRSPMGAGQGTSLTNRILGVFLGEEAHILTVGELAQHSHSYTGFSLSSGPVANGSGNGPVASTSGTAGSNQAHNTIHPCLVVKFYIKY